MSDSIWKVEFERRQAAARLKDERFAKSTDGLNRGEYLRKKWRHINDPDVNFCRGLRDGVDIVPGYCFENGLYPPRALLAFCRFSNGFGNDDRWMRFDILPWDDVIKWRLTEDDLMLDELGERVWARYRTFLTIGFVDRHLIQIRLFETPREDGVLVVHNYETLVTKVVSAGWEPLMNRVTYCMQENIKQNLVSPRGSEKKWLLSQEPAKPPEHFRQDGVKFRYQRLSNLPAAHRKALFD
ncbi:MAG: hypothetical protein AAFX44_18885 [Pseudomonadota bacterium]